MCIGDLSDVKEVIEKDGGRIKVRRKVNCFQEFINDCGFIDVLFKGQLFTWFNRREDLINLEWNEEYPNSLVFNLLTIGSDHSPILLVVEINDKKAPKRFKFEIIWDELEGCEDIIKKG